MTERPKVFVGLSGGVDSSVSAALLKKAGYEVTGVFIRVLNGDAELKRNAERGTDSEKELRRAFTVSGCSAADDRLDAMRVCAKLGIPFKELNLEKEYKKEVVDYMIREYKAGKTPNPDVFCNRFIKFGAFYRWARKNGADFVATGHYARILPSVRFFLSSPRKRGTPLDSRLHGNDKLVLCAGADVNKDQSYFLWQLRKEQLPHILFPVGGMRKPEVRTLAKKFGLITADKKDSQGLCFVGKVDMKEFLKHYIKPKRGAIRNEEGDAIGEHDGAAFYTLGERIALSLSPFSKGDPPERLFSRARIERGLGNYPYFVIAKNIRENTLTVSRKSPSGELPHAQTEAAIKDCNWIISPQRGKTYRARIRYRQPLQKCRGANTYDRKYLLLFENAQFTAAGQSLVLYDGEVVLGGGIIC